MELRNQIAKKLKLVVCGLVCVIFLFLSIDSLLATSVLDPNRYRAEHILYQTDSLFINILLLAAMFALVFVLNRLLRRVRLRMLTILLAVWVAAVGCVWVISVQSVPAADSGKITSAAAAFLSGDYSVLKTADSYFRYYPYQLGFTAICELFFGVFGSGNYVALAVVNVAFLAAAYLALIKLSGLVFGSRDVTRLTILLLAACLQPIFFCTYIYGNIIGFTLAIWAVTLELMYLKSRRKSLLIYAAVLIAIATVAKPNYYIFLAAMCIILLIDSIKRFSVVSVLAAVCAVALSVGANRAIISMYEAKAGTELGSGVPKILWAAMGLRNAASAPGWYDSYTVLTYRSCGYDGVAASEEARTEIAERLSEFASEPLTAYNFFANKILSQWNEPSYESVWVSRVKRHLTPVPTFVTAIYEGDGMDEYFNIFQLLIFTGFLIAMFKSLKKPEIGFTVLPLIVLGGFLYHLIFEAKSQYILIYFVLLVPYAASGLRPITEAAEKRLKRLKNRKMVNNTADM